jgi:hypothetical protein
MDHATQTALRAVLKGLSDAGTLNSTAVHGIMTALKDAAGEAQEHRESDVAKELIALCKGIHADMAVS